MELDLRTGRQKRAEELKIKIISLYKDVRNDNATASDNQVCEYIGRKLDISANWVRKRLMTEGIITKRI